jgi:lipid-A-disaccharide synthase
MTRPYRVMLVAAEASGDALGAELARALKRRLGSENLQLMGVGGRDMAAEGVASPFDISELSVLGAVEGVKAYPRVVARADETAALAARGRPDIAVLIDSWGFTLRVAQRLRKQSKSLFLVKYVGPQVWATRPGRAKTLARTVDHLLAIHAFDAPYFEAAGLKTTFVGNPSLSRDFSTADPARLRAHIGAAADDPILLMLPGSRPGEIARVMPPFEAAVGQLMNERPNLRVVLPLAPTVAATVKARLADWSCKVDVIEGDALKLDAMRAATVALACSGTVTTELALAGCPVVVGYRVAPITYLIARAIIRTRYISLLNIAAGEAVAPEFIQHDCNGPRLASALAERLDRPLLRAAQIRAQNDALEKMGRGQSDPSELAADYIVGQLSRVDRSA